MEAERSTNDIFMLWLWQLRDRPTGIKLVTKTKRKRLVCDRGTRLFSSLHCDSTFHISLITALRHAQVGWKLFMKDLVRFTSVQDGPKRVSVSYDETEACLKRNEKISTEKENFFKLELACFGCIEEGVRRMVNKVLNLLGCDTV
jgi:hypothetical protein